MEVKKLIILHRRGEGILNSFKGYSSEDHLSKDDETIINAFIQDSNKELGTSYILLPNEVIGHLADKPIGISKENSVGLSEIYNLNEIGDGCRKVGYVLGHIKGVLKAKGIPDKKDIEKLKDEIKNLKKGPGIFCKYIDRECNLSVSQKNQGFVIFDYEKKDFGRVIEKVLKDSDIEPIIAGHLSEEGAVGLFCVNICQKIRSSKVCIADVTKDNTNVGLEVGLAWRFNIPVFITFDKDVRKNPPSDLAAFTQIRYQDSKDLEEQLTNKIKSI